MLIRMYRPNGYFIIIWVKALCFLNLCSRSEYALRSAYTNFIGPLPKKRKGKLIWHTQSHQFTGRGQGIPNLKLPPLSRNAIQVICAERS